MSFLLYYLLLAPLLLGLLCLCVLLLFLLLLCFLLGLLLLFLLCILLLFLFLFLDLYLIHVFFLLLYFHLRLLLHIHIHLIFRAVSLASIFISPFDIIQPLAPFSPVSSAFVISGFTASSFISICTSSD